VKRVKRVKTRSIQKVLVANRGEIARRVMRSLREMGIASVAVHSDADAAAPHVSDADEAVRIGPARAAESYLVGERILEAARSVGADAIHPGYGFLSENAGFAAACKEAGIAFIGPSVEAIRRMGSKIESKNIMGEAGVPLIPGFSAVGLSDAAIATAAAEIGYPVLVKASAGGGGKGMRVVEDAADLPQALTSARREAKASFADDTLLIERYFQAPRHVEIQIFGDSHGHVIHCFERECSIQRRHQKVVEEAPSPALDEALRDRMGEAAVAAGKAIGYEGAGTVEFILDSSGDFYFLEVNTRLQVEHPVTEAITGLDLVRMQIEVARGEPLHVAQPDLAIRGHAIEVRLYAEKPENDFLPATGTMALWRVPDLPGLRVDSGIEEGSVVGVHYDPMLAKVIAYADSREEARLRLIRGLKGLALGGVQTNRDFLLAVLEHAAFAEAKLDTGFIDRHLPAEARQVVCNAEAAALHAIVATVALHEERLASGGPLPAGIPSGWRNNRWRAQEQIFGVGDATFEVHYIAQDMARNRALDASDTARGRFDMWVRAEGSEEQSGEGRETEAPQRDVRLIDVSEGALVVEIDGIRRRYAVVHDADTFWVHGGDATSELMCRPRFDVVTSEDIGAGCVAPMTGVIRSVNVAAGDRVSEGDVLIVLEAMKMEQPLAAHADGVVTEVRVEEGQMVDPDEVLLVIDADE